MLVPDTTPYAWPFDARFDPGRTALVICGSGGAWSARCAFDATIEANIDALRSEAARTGTAVVLLRHGEPRRVSSLVDGATKPLVPRDDDHVIDAAGIDGFYGSRLDFLLRTLGCDQLLFAGRGFEAAVHSTIRRANDRGYESLTIADACVCLDPALRGAAISTIEMSGGIFGAVGTTRAVLTTLSRFPMETST